MKFITAILIALAITGCRPDIEIEPEFLPMIDLYMSHAPSRGKLTDLREMRTGPLQAPLAGLTMIQDNAVGGVKFNGYTAITIAPETNRCAWNRAVLHELGHAVHGFEHVADPESIMFDGWKIDEQNPDLSWCDNLDEKLDRLFASGGQH